MSSRPTQQTPLQRAVYRAQFGFISKLVEKGVEEVAKPAVRRAGRSVGAVGRALDWYERNVPGRIRPYFQRLESDVQGLPPTQRALARIGLGLGGATAGGLLGLATAPATGPFGAIAGAVAGGTLAWGPASTKVWPYMLDPATYVGFGVAGTPLRTAARASQLAEAAGRAQSGRAAFRAIGDVLRGVEPAQRGSVSRALWQTAGVMDWPERKVLTGVSAVARRATQPAGEAGLLPRTRDSFAARVSQQGEAMMLDSLRSREAPVRPTFLEGILDADRAALDPDLRDLQAPLKLIERVHGREAVQRLVELPSPQAAREVGTLLDSAARSQKWIREPGSAWWKMTDPLWPELRESLSLPFMQRAWEVAGVRIPYLAQGVNLWQSLPPLKLINWVSRNSLRFGLYPEGNLVEGSLIQMAGDGKAVPSAFSDELVRTYSNHPALRELFSDVVPESMRPLAGREVLPTRKVVSGLAGAGQRALNVADPIRRNVTYSNKLGQQVFKVHFAQNWMKMLDDYGRRHGATALNAVLDDTAFDSALAFRVMKALPDGPEAVAEAAGALSPINAVRQQMYERLSAEFPVLRPDIAAHLGAWKARGFQGTDGLVNVIRDGYQAAGVEDTILAPEMATDVLRLVTDGIGEAGTAADVERWRTVYEVASGLKMTAERRTAQGIHGWAASLPLEEQEAAITRYEEAATEMTGQMDDAFQAATDALRNKGDELGLPWAKTYADVSGQLTAATRDARRRTREALDAVLRVPRGRRTPETWGEFYATRDAIWQPVTQRMAGLHMARWDAQLRTALAATKAEASDLSVVQVLEDIASGQFRSQLDDNMRRQGEKLIERVSEFQQVPPELAQMASEADRGFVERAVRTAGQLSDEQRQALRNIESEALDRASRASRDIALWGRDVNVGESFLRSLGIPFISYELRRPVRFGLLAARRPSAVLDMWRYWHATDDFYVDMPGTPLDFSFARMIGLGPVRTLLAPTFDPEHEGALGVMERAGDWASKFGIFPMGLELASASTLAANGDMEGLARFLSVPPAQAVLDVAGLAGVPGAAQFHEAFPEPFREQMVRAQLIDWGIDPDAATEEERDRAFKSTALPSLIASQTGINRYRPEGLKSIWAARGQAAAKAGVPKEVVDGFVRSGRNPIYARDPKGVFYLDTAQQRQALRAAAERAGVSEDVVAASSRSWLHIKPQRQQKLVSFRQQLGKETAALEETLVVPAAAQLDEGAITLEDFRRTMREAAIQRSAIRANALQTAGLTEEDLRRPQEGLRAEDFAADAYYSIELQDFNGNGQVDDADWEEFKNRRRAVLDQNAQHSRYILEEYPRSVWSTPRVQELSQEYAATVRQLDEFMQLPRWKGLNGEQSRRVDEMRHFVEMLTQEYERREGQPLRGREAQAIIWRQAAKLLKPSLTKAFAPYEIPLLAKGLGAQDVELFRAAYRIAQASGEERELARDPAPTLFTIGNPDVMRWYPSMVERILGSRRLRIVASEMGLQQHPGIAELLGGGV